VEIDFSGKVRVNLGELALRGYFWFSWGGSMEIHL
jgi:hypothetical protein